MGWFSPATHLSAQASTVLTELATSGSSEDAGVADTLNTIAQNGEDSATDEYILGCAEQMLAAAVQVIQALRAKAIVRVHPTTESRQLCCPICIQHVALMYVEEIENARQQLDIENDAAYFEALYKTDGLDDGRYFYLYCDVCAGKFQPPDGMELTFV